MVKKRTTIMAAAVIMAICVHAKVKLPHVIGDNMVLQQNTEARLWGWDTPGKQVKVSVSWSEKTYSVKTGKDGRWMVSVQTPMASYTPLSITFDDGEAVTVRNVLSGEVIQRHSLCKDSECHEHESIRGCQLRMAGDRYENPC